MIFTLLQKKKKKKIDTQYTPLKNENSLIY